MNPDWLFHASEEADIATFPPARRGRPRWAPAMIAFGPSTMPICRITSLRAIVRG